MSLITAWQTVSGTRAATQIQVILKLVRRTEAALVRPGSKTTTQDHDTVYIRLHETPRTAESDEVEPGVIVDYGPDGQIVGFDLLNAQGHGPWAEWVRG